MKLTSALQVPLAATCLIILAGCTDLEPIRAQIDDLKSQLGKLQTDTARAMAAANAAAADASSVAAGAQNAVSEVQSETEANSKAIAALDEKIDRMFKRPLAKASVTAE
jgi:predicted  nucleic acid-binding Zn-ribbon protein